MKHFSAPILTVALTLPLVAQADANQFVVSTGLKGFNASWETTPYDSNGNLLSTVKSDNSAFAFTPYFSLRMDSFVTSFSYTPDTTYKFGSLEVKKKESDISAGYALDGSYFLLGYKTVDQVWGDFTQKNSGLYFGYQVGLNISGPWGGYLNAAYSPSFAAKLGDGRTVDGTYFVAELGATYSLGPVIANTKNLAFTAGLRYQTVDTTDYKDTFSGLTLGVNVSF